MNKYYVLTLFLIIHSTFLWAQQEKTMPDSLVLIHAKTAYQKAQQFRTMEVYDSSNYYFRQAGNLYRQVRMYTKYWDAMNDLAYNYTSEGKFEEARQILNRTLDVNSRYASGKNKTSADAYYTLAITYFREQNFDAEIENLEKALAVQEEIYKWKRNPHPDIATTKNTIGIAYSYKKEYNTALAYFLEAKEIREMLYKKYHPTLATSYRNIGDTYKKLDQYDSALDYFEKELVQVKAMTRGTPHSIWARSYKSIADTYFLKGNPEKALEFFGKSEALNRNLHGANSLEVSSDYNNLGAVHSAIGKYDIAIEFFDKSLIIKQKHLEDTHPEIAQLYNNLGVSYAGKSDPDKALEYHQKALQIRKDNFGENHTQVAISLNNMGEVYDLKGEYDIALDYFMKSMTIREQINGKKHPETALAYSNVGAMYGQKGEYVKAIDYHAKALEIRQAVFKAKHPDIARSYNNIGMIHYQKKNYKEAINYYEKALDIRLEVLGNQHPDVAQSYNNMGVAEYLKENYIKALDYYTKSMEIRAEVFGTTHPDLAQVYNNIGSTYFKMNEYEQALEFYMQTLRLQELNLGKKHPSVAGTYNNLAGGYYQIKQYEKSLTNFHLSLIANSPNFEDKNLETMPLTHDFMDAKRAVTALLGKAEAWLKLHQKQANEAQLKLAYQHLLSADELIDQTRNLYANEADKILLAETVHQMTDLAIQVCKNLHIYSQNIKYLHDTFYFIEKSKSAVLLASIAARNFDALPKELLEQEKYLRQEISIRENKLMGERAGNHTLDAKKLGLLQNKIFDLKRQYDKLIQEFKQKHPKYYDLKYDVKIKSVADLRQSILKEQPKTAILQYFIGRNDMIYIGILTAQKYEILRLTGANQMDKSVRGLRNAIKFQVDKVYAEYASELHQMIMEPVERYLSKNKLKINKLIIINDGMTAYLPFGTLLTKKVKNIEKINYKKLHYLNKRYTLSYTFSATLMDNKYHQKLFGDSSYIAFAPVFQEDTEGSVLNERGNTISAWASASFMADGRNITPLPATKIETESIQNLYERKKMTTRNMTEKHASEFHLKTNMLQQYRYIHFATHGFMDENNPYMSGLLMAQDATSKEDGILYAGEIYNLELKADLVMLSACQTGLGKIVRGEGLIGLTRGFLYAGAKNVGVSMWKVADESTSQLMIQFYKQLLRNKTKAKALQKAKRKLIRSKTYQHPYYWGSFVLIGAE